jgi:hypothetical protein
VRIFWGNSLLGNATPTVLKHSQQWVKESLWHTSSAALCLAEQLVAAQEQPLGPEAVQLLMDEPHACGE